MWSDTTFAGERIAVVGLGRNGLPAARALAALGADVVAWDDGAAARDAAVGVTIAEPDFAQVDMLVLSPGIPHTLPSPHPIAAAAQAAGVPILSDAEMLFQAARRNGSEAKFVGVTGTNGKSTTTALLAHILGQAGVNVCAGGNLGIAALALPHDADVYVLEMSSYMLERLRTMRFDVAAMLNLSPDHLDRHGDMAGYAGAKREIFARQDERDHAVVGVDDVYSRDAAAWLRGEPASVTTISAADRRGDTHALRGAHNAQNAAAATAVARALGIAESKIADAISSFPGLAHRQEVVATRDGVAFVNDSKATNAASTAHALAAFPRVVWIAGGIAKAGGIEALAPLFGHVASAVLIGRDAEMLARTLSAHGVAHGVVDTLMQAVPLASNIAREAEVDTVLLSPACASFDQFTGFEARGDAFRAAVAALGGER